MPTHRKYTDANTGIAVIDVHGGPTTMFTPEEWEFLRDRIIGTALEMAEVALAVMKCEADEPEETMADAFDEDAVWLRDRPEFIEKLSALGVPAHGLDKKNQQS